MSIQSQYPIVNPRLRTFYAILASAIVSFVVLLNLFEQLGLQSLWLNYLMVGVPVIFAIFVALATMTRNADDFFISGRRVPAGFAGVLLVLSTLGGAGLTMSIGIFYFIGFDGLSLLLGWAAGFLLLGVLFAPFFRKMGAYTTPSFLAVRFNSGLLRLTCSIVLIIPLFLLVIAELKIGIFVLGQIIQAPAYIMAAIFGALILVMTLPGGSRSLTWSQCVLFIILFLGVFVPLGILSIYLTNLPLPQITYGIVLDDLARLELSNGMGPTNASPLGLAFPGEQAALMQKSFIQSFGALKLSDFICLSLVMACGCAVLPSLLTRVTTVPTVYDARRAVGWGIFFLGLFLLSIPAYAVFTKILTLQNLVGTTIDQLPDWAGQIVRQGLVYIVDRDQNTNLGANEILVKRDGVFLLMPILAKFPVVFAALAIAAICAGALGAAASHCLAIAQMFSEDLYHGLFFRKAKDRSRLAISRFILIVVVAIAIWAVAALKIGALNLMIWGVSLCGATLFMPLLLSIWWKRASGSAAFFAIVSGFCVTALYIIATEFNGGSLILGLDNRVAAIIGLVVSFFVMVVMSVLSGAPAAEMSELVDEMRSAEGESLYERAIRTKTSHKVSETLRTRPVRP